MIELVEIPQRSDDYNIKYEINGDVLSVTVNGINEIFDFTGLPEGVAESIISENLPINPILSAKKIGDVVTIEVSRVYGHDEKHLFEVREDG